MLAKVISKLTRALVGLQLVDNNDKFMQLPTMMRKHYGRVHELIESYLAQCRNAKESGSFQGCSVTKTSQCGPFVTDAKKIQALITSTYSQIQKAGDI